MQVLKKLCGSAASTPSTTRQIISGPGIQEILLPADGNCLFGSLALGKHLLESLAHGAPIGHRGVSLTMEEWGELCHFTKITIPPPSPPPVICQLPAA